MRKRDRDIVQRVTTALLDDFRYGDVVKWKHDRGAIVHHGLVINVTDNFLEVAPMGLEQLFGWSAKERVIEAQNGIWSTTTHSKSRFTKVHDHEADEETA